MRLARASGRATHPHRRVKILMVGQLRRLHDIDRTVLRRNEIQLLRADPGPEVLNQVQREAVDLIVIDCGPGDRMGLELCANLKSLPVTEDIAVMVLAPPTLVEEAEQARPDAILFKPFLEREFLSAVRRYTRVVQRRHARYPVNLRFTFSFGSRVGQAFSRVLSCGGAFLKTDLPMPRGTRLNLRFRLPGDESEIVCAGVVRNTLGWEETADLTPGFGVEFEGVRPSDRVRLEEFVESLEGRVAPQR